MLLPRMLSTDADRVGDTAVEMTVATRHKKAADASGNTYITALSAANIFTVVLPLCYFISTFLTVPSLIFRMFSPFAGAVSC